MVRGQDGRKKDRLVGNFLYIEWSRRSRQYSFARKNPPVKQKLAWKFNGACDAYSDETFCWGNNGKEAAVP